MKKIAFDQKRFKSETKAHCAHQAMMEMVITEGYAKGKWIPVWARIIKRSGINDLELERLIDLAQSLPGKYSACGFVRNRLIEKDWIKYFAK
jgi:hypothetical protein